MRSPHVDIRGQYLLSHGSDTCYGLGDWRRYSSGAWPVISEYVIREEITQLAIAYGKARVTASLVQSVLDLLRARLHIPDHIFDGNPNLIVFSDVALDLNTNSTVPHSPDHYFTASLPYKYDPTVTSPVWTRFLTHCPCVELLQEFAGYCLTPQTQHETALWLWGPPGGGKSTFICGLEVMLGQRACTLGLSDLERSSFALSQLPGKYLAVSTEQPSQFLRSTHLINAIISGESININRKYRDAYTAIPRAKLVWAMNELPQVDPSSGAGLFRRVLPIHWPEVPEADRDPWVKEGIRHAGMAIVNWALEGYTRFSAAQKFTIPDALTKGRNLYRRLSDHYTMFLDDCIERRVGVQISSSTLYTAYKDWCEACGHKRAYINRLSANMYRLGLESVHTEKGTYWMDIQVKSTASNPYKDIDVRGDDS